MQREIMIVPGDTRQIGTYNVTNTGEVTIFVRDDPLGAVARVARMVGHVEAVVEFSDGMFTRISDDSGRTFQCGLSSPGAQAAHADLVATLCDLAREGRREDFNDLARMNGVSEGELDTMWQGTLARVATPR